VIILNVFHNGFLMNVIMDLVYPNNKLNKWKLPLKISYKILFCFNLLYKKIQTSWHLNWHNKLKNYRTNSELNGIRNYIQGQLHVSEKLKRMAEVSTYRKQSIYMVTRNIKTPRTWTSLVIWRFILPLLWKYNCMKLSTVSGRHFLVFTVLRHFVKR